MDSTHLKSISTNGSQEESSGSHVTQSVKNPNGLKSDSGETPVRNSTWVQFDDDGRDTTGAAVINAESVQVNIAHTEDTPIAEITLAPVNNVDHSSTFIRHSFSNGDVVVTLLPVNTKWPWITSAQFRPELVPEELMAQGLTLTVEEYVHSMELLVNDVRFTLYNICYKRVLICWITLAFVVLLALLFSGLTGLTLFSLGVAWLLLNGAAIFLCMWLKLQLSRGLEHCLARVNKLLMKHKLLMALDDRGKISCHKVNLCFIYFDCNPCIEHLRQFIEREEGAAIAQGWERRLDVTANDIVIQGGQTTRLSRKQERAALLYLRYVGRWGTRVVQGKLKISSLSPGRHGEKHNCPCQFVEEHLRCKPPPGLCKYFSVYDDHPMLQTPATV